jgi:tetratricopeptide (TPR) repeat protein
MDSLRVAASEALAANDTETALHAFGYLAIYQAMAGHGDQARFHVTLAEGLLEQLRRPVRLDAEFHIHRGLMLRALGDLPAAAEDLQLAVDLRNRVYGQDSLETAQAKNNLAAVLYSLRRFVEAERLYLEVLALRTRRLGPKHSSRLVLLHNLGALYTDTDRFAEALSLFDDVLAQMPDVGGKPHPHRRTVQSFRGAALLGLGRTDEAEAAVRESLAQTEALLGVDSPESVMALVTLVEVAVARGNITADTILLAARAVKLSETKAKAAPLWARALFVQARVLAPSDPAQARLLVHRAMAALPKETLPLAVEQRHIEKVRALVENR